jgi:L-threonine kinase
MLGLTGTGVSIGVFSDIPAGKGMASSTADISATCAAVAWAAGVRLSVWNIAGIALSIEPTDAIMFPGIALFDHVEGKVARVLGEAPDMEAVVVDLGGTVDTVSFNANLELDNMNRLKEHKIAQALEKIEKGLARGDIGLIGEAAAESAFANQHILHKPELDRLFHVCRELGGVGVNVAHSGTVIGLLFEAGGNSAVRAQSVLAERGYKVFCRSRLIGGGIQILTDEAGEKIWEPLNGYMGETFGKQRKITG